MPEIKPEDWVPRVQPKRVDESDTVTVPWAEYDWLVRMVAALADGHRTVELVHAARLLEQCETRDGHLSAERVTKQANLQRLANAGLYSGELKLPPTETVGKLLYAGSAVRRARLAAQRHREDKLRTSHRVYQTAVEGARAALIEAEGRLNEFEENYAFWLYDFAHNDKLGGWNFDPPKGWSFADAARAALSAAREKGVTVRILFNDIVVEAHPDESVGTVMSRRNERTIEARQKEARS